jgi:hypothetical protein
LKSRNSEEGGETCLLAKMEENKKKYKEFSRDVVMKSRLEKGYDSFICQTKDLKCWPEIYGESF